jgi:hypothetical protein
MYSKVWNYFLLKPIGDTSPDLLDIGALSSATAAVSLDSQFASSAASASASVASLAAASATVIASSAAPIVIRAVEHHALQKSSVDDIPDLADFEDGANHCA